MNHLSQATNSLLMQLVMDLKNGYIRRCEALGLAPAEMLMLQSLTIEDLHYLGNSPVSVLSVYVHHANLVRILHQARIEQQRMKRIDRALELGGSIELMHYFLACPV
ncbi:STY4526/YPO1902 family pathogenicity island replication protein, partial [Xenorhabdus sp. SGI240]|uniref:STY4526/YPO1902 family pathogenicity island replication protein n=1 Tax=Xenorhabdus sp. SGI240 TaxID=3158262 RepID=UPI0032B73FE6